MKHINHLSGLQKKCFFLFIYFIVASISNSYAQNWQPIGPDDNNWPLYFADNTPSATSMCVNSTGTPYIAYADPYNGQKATVKKFNGTTWEIVGVAGFSSSAVEIAKHGLTIFNGIPYIVYTDVDNENKATVEQFNGTGWVNVGLPDFTTAGATKISLAITNTAIPYIAYLDDNSFIQSMVFNGNGWVPMPDLNLFATDLDMAIAPNGNPYLAYAADENNTGSYKVSVVYYPGVNWFHAGPAGFSAGENARGISLTVDASGNPYVFYVENDVSLNQVASVKSFTGNWNDVGTPNFPVTGNNNSIAISPSGTPYIIYSNDYSPVIRSFNGSSWTDVGGAHSLKAGYSYSDYMQIAIDNNGVPYAGFTVGGNSFGIQKFANSSWSFLGDPGIATDLSYDIDLAVKNDGNPVIAFIKTTGIAGIASDVLSVKTYDGSSWSDAGNSPTANRAIYPAIALDASGVTYVAFNEYIGNVFSVVCKKLVGNSWVYVGGSIFSGLSEKVRLVIDPAGVPYVAYRGTNGEAVVKKFNGSSWVVVGTEPISSNYTGDISLALAPDGTLYLAYKDYSQTSFDYKPTVKKFNGSSWVTVGIERFSTGGTESNSGDQNTIPLAFDAGGTPYIAYAEYDPMFFSRASIKKFDGSSWVNMVFSTFAVNPYLSLSLAVNANGEPCVAYNDSKGLVKRFNGNNWVNIPGNFSAGSAVFSVLKTRGQSYYVAYTGSFPFVKKYTDNTNSCTVAVSIAASPAGAICAGSSVTFTATPSNGGTVPVYQWKNNGINTGTNSNTYTSSSLLNSDIITCELTSNAACATTPLATSNAILMTVNAIASVTLTGSGNNCLGTTLSLSGASNASQITWYNGNDPVNTVSPTYAVNGITVAGGNGPGTGLNQLSGPQRLYVDPSGNIYICDVYNSRIQKWIPGATSGITVAGGNGPGTGLNQFNYAAGIFVDASGNIYAADMSNHRIQKWLPGATSGITVAGGNGPGNGSNELNNPTAVYVDTNGDMYIADKDNNRIQKWLPGATSGITVAGGNGIGSNANQLTFPIDIAIDAMGNIYVADMGNQRIQKWTVGASTGITVAGGNGIGSASNQFHDPYAICIDPSQNIYIADYSNNRIQKWLPGAITGITIAGGNGAGTGLNQLSQPSGVFVDNSGDIYVADLINARIQKWIPNINTSYTPLTSGVYTAVVTSNNGCSVTSNTVTVDPLVSPSVSISVSATTICQGTAVTFTATAINGGSTPSYQWKKNGINAGSNNLAYTDASLVNGDVISCVLTSNASCVSSSTATSNLITMTVNSSMTPSVSIIATSTTICVSTSVTFTATPVNGGSSPTYQWKKNGGSVGTNNPVYADAALVNGDVISCILTSNASCVSGNTATSNTIVMTVNAMPSVTLTNSGSNCLGTTLSLSGASGASQINWYNGNTAVNAVSSAYATAGITVAGGNGNGNAANQLNNPTGMFIDVNGYIYIADPYNYRVQKWFPGANSGITVAGGNGSGTAANQLDTPTGMYVDNSGNVFVADFFNHRIQKWSPGANTGITVAGGNGLGGAANQLNHPFSVYVDNNGNIYVADEFNNRIQKWAPGASIGITVAGGNGPGNAANQLNGPTGIVFDVAGNMYITDYNNHRIQECAQGAITGITVAGGNGLGNGANQFNNPIGLYMDQAANIFVADFNNSRIQKWAPGANSGITVAGGNGPGSAANQFDHPSGVFVDNTGNIYITDQFNNRVQKWTYNINTDFTPLITGIYTAVVTNISGCSVTSNPITINPLVSPSLSIAASTTSACQGISVSFTATAVNGGSSPSYQWKKNGINAGSNDPVYTDAALMNGDVISCVLTSNASCVSSSTATSNPITMTVNPLPLVSAGSYGPYTTTTAAVTLTGSPMGGSFSGTGVSGNSFDPSIAGVGTYTIIYSYTNENGCSNTAQTTITVTGCSGGPAIGNINGLATVCGIAGTATTSTYSVTNTTGTTYVWTKSSTLIQIASGQGTNTINAGFSATFTTGTITVTATNTCGSTVKTITVTKKTPVVPGTISGNTNPCLYTGTGSGATTTYYIAKVAGALTYIWTVPADITIIAGSSPFTTTDTSITVSFAPGFVSGAIQVQASNDCGTSAPKSLSLLPKVPAVPGTISGPLDICGLVNSGVDLVYSINRVPNASSYLWQLPAGASINSATGDDTSITVLFPSSFTTGAVKVSAVSGCGSSAFKSLTVTAKIPSTPGTISGPTDPCDAIGSNSDVTYSIHKVPFATSYAWQLPAGVTVTSSGLHDTAIVVSFAGTYTTGVIGVRAINGCGNSSAYKNLTVAKKLPAMPGAITVTAGDICTSMFTGTSTVTYTIPANTALPLPTSYLWTLAPAIANSAVIISGSGTVGTPTSTSIETTGLSIQVQYHSTYTTGILSVVSKKACGNSTTARKLTITKNLPPTPAVPTASGTICSGVASSVTYTVTANANTDQYIWTSPAGTRITGSRTASPTRDTTAVNSITVNYPTTFVSGSITVKVRSVCGISSVATLTVARTACFAGNFVSTTSRETDQQEEMTTGVIYPNPNNGSFSLKIRSTNTTDGAAIQITDILGQVVANYTRPNNKGNIVLEVNDGKLKNGIYFLRYTVGKEVKTLRFVVQH